MGFNARFAKSVDKQEGAMSKVTTIHAPTMAQAEAIASQVRANNVAARIARCEDAIRILSKRIKTLDGRVRSLVAARRASAYAEHEQRRYAERQAKRRHSVELELEV
jgi:hypothetical protein